MPGVGSRGQRRENALAEQAPLRGRRRNAADWSIDPQPSLDGQWGAKVRTGTAKDSRIRPRYQLSPLGTPHESESSFWTPEYRCRWEPVAEGRRAYSRCGSQ
eukprot:590397-Prorocentrum_minimum.AAC.1